MLCAQGARTFAGAINRQRTYVDFATHAGGSYRINDRVRASAADIEALHSGRHTARVHASSMTACASKEPARSASTRRSVRLDPLARKSDKTSKRMRASWLASTVESLC